MVCANYIGVLRVWFVANFDEFKGIEGRGAPTPHGVQLTSAGRETHIYGERGPICQHNLLLLLFENK